MLDSVLFARDKWLTKDGLMFPDKVSFYVAGLEDVDFQNEKGTAENSFTQYFNVYLVLNSSLGKFWGLQRLIVANIL